MRVLNLLCCLLVISPLVVCPLVISPKVLASATATASIQSPHQKVEVVTDQVIKLILTAKTYFEKDPNRFYKEIEILLDPLVDFPTFARGVMGTYGTKDYYNSLKSQAEKEAFKSNYDRFVKIFRQGLINTYGKGLLAFDGQKTAVAPAKPEDAKKVAKGGPVDVLQTVQGKDEKYQILYKMRRNKKGEWQLQNVTIETINVGLLYRNQFADSMNSHNNDFGKVVDNWTVAPQKVEVAKDQPKK